MKEHKWVELWGYYGQMGWNPFWKCTECSADGGPHGAFIADGTGTQLSMDCDEAMKQIASHPGRKEPKKMKNPFRYLGEIWEAFLYSSGLLICDDCDGFGTPEGSIQGDPKCTSCEGTGKSPLCRWLEK